MNAKIFLLHKLTLVFILVCMLLALYPVMSGLARETMWDDPGGKPPPNHDMTLITCGDSERLSNLELVMPGGGMGLYCNGRRYVVPGNWSLILCPEETEEP